jgi:excisionase family DNA binding protein
MVPLTRLSYRAPDITALTGLSKHFVYKLIREGALPAVRIGSSVSVLHDDLVDFLAAHRQPATAPTEVGAP